MKEAGALTTMQNLDTYRQCMSRNREGEPYVQVQILCNYCNRYQEYEGEREECKICLRRTTEEQQPSLVVWLDLEWCDL